jgi:RNA polymerase sigma factor (sigma-70 family)
MGFAHNDRDDYRSISREDVDYAFVRIYSRWKSRGQWDEEGWAILWEYSRAIIAGQVRCPGDANEVQSRVAQNLQEVFETRKEIRRPTQYLNKIIAHALCDHGRANKKKFESLDGPAGEHQAETISASPESNADIAHSLADIVTELRRLLDSGRISVEDQRAFHLRFIIGCTVREVALRIGCSPSFADESSKKVLKKLQKSIRGREVMFRLGHTH